MPAPYKDRHPKAPNGYTSCVICYAIFKKKYIGRTKVSLCEECLAKTIECATCGKETKMYEYDTGRKRTYCDRACSDRNDKRRITHSEFMKNKLATDDEYKKQTIARLEEYIYGEAGRKIRSDRLKLLWQSSDYSSNMSKMMIEKWSDPEYHSRVNAARLETMQSDEYRANMAEIVRQRWANDSDYADKVITGVEKRMRLGIKTDIEVTMDDVLGMLGIRYKYNLRVWKYFIDFALLDYNIGIECDGEYWHEDTIDSDKERDSQLAKRGWKIIRIWGKEIKSDVIRALSMQIPDIVESALMRY